MTGASEPAAWPVGPPGPPGAGRGGGTVKVAALLLVLATVAVYWPVGGFAFTCFDDQGYVYENMHVKAGLTWDNVQWAATTTEECNWHPLTWLSHMLDRDVYGLGGPRGNHLTSRLNGVATALGLPPIGGPGGHHVTNLLLHLGATLLLFAALRRMTSAVWPSAAVAALFAVHPLHVESVAWVAERKDVLSTFFEMAALVAYVRYAQRSTADLRGALVAIAWYAAVLLLFAMGLASKPMVVTFPLVLLLLDYWPLGRLKFQVSSSKFQVDGCGDPPRDAPATPRWATALWLVLEKLPLLALSAAAAYKTYYAQCDGGSMGFASSIDLGTRAANAVVAYGTYLAKMVVPIGLSPFYPYVRELDPWRVAMAAAVLVAVTALVSWQVRRRPYLAVGWLWYLGTLVPVIGLVQVGQQSMADRYTYVPLVGVFIALVWLVWDLASGLPRIARRALAAAAAGAIVVLGVVAFFQVWTWADSVALFSHAVDVTENNHLAHNNLGVALREVGRDDEAMENFREALAIKPDYSDAHNNFGIELAAHGQPDEAIVHYTEALRLFPDFPEAEENMGIILYGQGRMEEAVEHYASAIRLRPHYADAHYNMGLALAAIHRTAEAVEHYRECVRLSPDDPVARRVFGRALIKMGQYEEAAANLREAMRLDPSDSDAASALAEAERALAEARDRTAAPQ